MAVILAFYLPGAFATLGIILWAMRCDIGRMNLPRTVIGVALWPCLWLLACWLELRSSRHGDWPKS